MDGEDRGARSVRSAGLGSGMRNCRRSESSDCPAHGSGDEENDHGPGQGPKDSHEG